MTVFLANVQLWTSTIGFLVQIFLDQPDPSAPRYRFRTAHAARQLSDPRPLSCCSMPALWAPGLARVIDQSLRYTVDKTTREVLYMPLPSDMKFAAKPFVDVTVDRFAKGMGSVLLLFLIKPWGLGLAWQRLSYASIVITAVWIFIALKARHGYKEAFRKSINTRADQAGGRHCGGGGSVDNRDSHSGTGQPRRTTRSVCHRIPGIARQEAFDHSAASLS